ncbi:MAG: RagB/SusD family nutrient uptake outer membrane protein [Chryseobacterium sp.]|nr:MAG: RagB/SusD family nutrient uptake outer membrane protein [Chryseobacterium sp.]
MILIKKIKFFCICFLSSILLVFLGCKKTLEEKSNQSLVIPTTIEDAQAILDYNSILNENEPGSAEISADDYYLTDSDWSSLIIEQDQNTYKWKENDLFRLGTLGNDWGRCYSAVYYCNTVLDALRKIDKTPSNSTAWNNVLGQALVFRASRFLGALQVWSLAYDENTYDTDLGIPLRINSDFNEISVRSNVKDSYEQVISDLKQAIPLLPLISISTTRPSKPAAYALLARTYLSMRKYKEAGLYADSCLIYKSGLINYNLLNTSLAFPITVGNEETVFYKEVFTGDPINKIRAKIFDPLYRSYSEGDLRKKIFFVLNTDGSYSFKGNYTGRFALFGGIATNEMYLTRAECFARNGKMQEAMNDLNKLLENRWTKVDFKPLIATNSDDALRIILSERRKELLMRGLRWMDIKRLNKEGYGISLTRIISGVRFVLPPNDLRFALPIPDDVIKLSGMVQNPR